MNNPNAITMNGPNGIPITIADPDIPIVVFFGPPACGKTMTLIRLSIYLNSQNYTVAPVRSFRPSNDTAYINMCNDFNAMVANNNAAPSTSLINFMLVRVLKQGKPLCQILEAPGEAYFDPGNPQAPFPQYVNAIINNNNRKIWAIMVEPVGTNQRMDTQTRALYANRIKMLKRNINPRDRAIFIFNKVDVTDFFTTQGNVVYKSVMNETQHLYPGIFAPFMNVVPIVKQFRPYDFDFVAFQSGSYVPAINGTLTFQKGRDLYPARLWQSILKCIRN